MSDIVLQTRNLTKRFGGGCSGGNTGPGALPFRPGQPAPVGAPAPGGGRTADRQGTTVFLSSYLLHEVEQICDRVAVLHRGRVVAEGPVGAPSGEEQVVRVRVPSPAQAVYLLESLPGVTWVEANGAYVEVRGVPPETVVAHLTTHGIVPWEVTTERPDLETLFLSLTQETSDTSDE